MTVKKRVRIYTADDVSRHNSRDSCWVSRNGKVYDVTGFLADHPGGEDYILAHAGGEVSDVMVDKETHDHSESAYEMLDEFVIGRLNEGETIVSDNWVADENYHPENTDELKDFEKNQFLDLRRPLIRQVWEANFSKNYYLKQVHQPRHLPEPIRLFGPSYLEIFTRTKWFVVPLIWLPVATNLFVRSFVGFTRPLPNFVNAPLYPYSANVLASVTPEAFAKAGVCVLIGNFIWTVLEYMMHRFLFHMDELLPDHPIAILLHFLLHGIHHYVPMDRLRLVMPPILFSALSFPFTRLAYFLFPVPIANGIIAGAFYFYVLYDCMHYALHHTSLPAYMREMKKYHLAHHYKNYELAFGVTSKIWDYVFGTVLEI
ncbi:hypothetical protein ACEPAG_2302 [Sanghuangporus baumii]